MIESMWRCLTTKKEHRSFFHVLSLSFTLWLSIMMLFFAHLYVTLLWHVLLWADERERSVKECNRSQPIHRSQPVIETTADIISNQLIELIINQHVAQTLFEVVRANGTQSYCYIGIHQAASITISYIYHHIHWRARERDSSRNALLDFTLLRCVWHAFKKSSNV